MYIRINHHSKGVWNSLFIVYSASLLSVKSWTKGSYDMPYKNPYFFVTTEPDRLEMQISSYKFIILKYIQINSQFRKILMLKFRLSFFGDNLYTRIIYFI